MNLNIKGEREETYPAGELAHSYLSILDDLWQLPNLELIQRPLVKQASEFDIIKITYAPTVAAPLILTTVYASFATLQILDAVLIPSSATNEEWKVNDWDIGNNLGLFGTVVIDPNIGPTLSQPKPKPYETAKQKRRRLRRREEPDSLSHALSQPPSPNNALPANRISLSDLNALQPPSPPTNPSSDASVTITITFYPSLPLPYKEMIYHLRTFITTCMTSTSSDSLETRWHRDQTISPDPRATIADALMVIRGPRGLFPALVTFADLTDGIRQILAACVRHGEWVAFKAAIYKDGSLAAEMVMKDKRGPPGAAVASA